MRAFNVNCTTRGGIMKHDVSVRIAASVLPTVTVKLHGFPTLKATCGQLGFFDVSTWDSMVRTQILPALRSQGVNPKTFPLFLTLNVVLIDGDLNHCCT